MRRLVPLLLALGLTLAGCTVESPFSLNGKPKLSGPRCAAGPGACPADPQP